MYLRYLKLAILMSLSSAAPCLADIVPVLNVIKQPDFGDIIFTPGSCRLDYISGSINDLSSSNICIYSDEGTVGEYTITANPNRLYQIKILQRDNEGDNLLFVPEGEISSNAQSVAIIPNVTQQINSGSIGLITIRFGGTLYINQYLTPSTTYQITKENGIEWSELP